MSFINFIFSDFLGQNVLIPQYQNVSQRAACPNTPNLNTTPIFSEIIVSMKNADTLLHRIVCIVRITSTYTLFFPVRLHSSKSVYFTENLL